MTQTAISALIAVFDTALALAIVSRQKFGNGSLPLSALFLGLGIGGVHYLGMYAIRGRLCENPPVKSSVPGGPASPQRQTAF